MNILNYSRGASQDFSAFYGFLVGPGLPIAVSYHGVSSGLAPPS
jgi:hypothetical protein